MSLQFVVSVLGNAMKQHAQFKRLTPTTMNMCILNVGFRNMKVLCSRSRPTHFHATNFSNKYISLHIGPHRQSNSFRCYCINSSEFDKQKSEDEKVMYKQDPGPVKISLSQEGLLRIETVKDNTDTDTNDGFDSVEKVSVEVKLLEFINCNQIDRAIELLRKAVESKKPPHANVVISLLERMSEAGSVETILQLELFLLDNKLCNEIFFLRNLTVAFHESGKITEAVEYLKTLCENNQDYSKIQKTFIYIASMILKEFPQFQSDIVSMVDQYKVSKFSQLERDLWKCFILSENFKEAEKYLKENENLNKVLSLMVSELNSDIRNVNNFTDEEGVWKYLLVSGEGWKLKKGLLLRIYEEYLDSLARKEKFRGLISNLHKAKKNEIKIHKARFDIIRRLAEKSVLTDEAWKQLAELVVWYEKTEEK